VYAKVTASTSRPINVNVVLLLGLMENLHYLQLYVLVKLRMGMEFENFTYLATNEKTYI
jgi:hypothetical protein